MKELDFDELDRAVSSLMGGMAPSDLESPKADKTKTITLPLATSSSNKKEPVAMSDVKPVQHIVKEPEPTPEIDSSSTSSDISGLPSETTTRKGGRFMDVVHISSDMKTASNASSRPSRSGVTIEPRISTVTDTAAADAFIAPETPEEISTEPDAQIEEPLNLTNDWPDPLEMETPAEVGDTPEVPEEIPEEPRFGELPTTPDETEATQPLPDIEPLISPFLQDTKVEKRPLGTTMTPLENMLVPETQPEAPITTEQYIPTNIREDIEESHDVDAQLPPGQASPAIHLPEELQDELMAVESDTTTMPINEPVKQMPQDVTPARTSNSPFMVAQTSINQQYREEPSTSDQESGSIYDTSSYHQPLSHPAKKNSGWMWVVWIVLILLLGAASGAALYFSGII